MGSKIEVSSEHPALPLQIRAIVGEAYVVCFQYVGLWLKVTAVPVAVIAALTILSLQLVNGLGMATAKAPSVTSVIAIFLFTALIYLSQVPLATARHRLILKSGDTGSQRYMIGGPKGRYFLKILIIALIVIAVSLMIGLLLSGLVLPLLMGITTGERGLPNLILLGLIGTVISLGLYSVLGYFLGYLLLMLPAAAIGRNYVGSEASAAIKGNEWRLVGVYVVAMLPLIILEYLFGWLLGGLVLKSGILLAIVQYGPTLLFAPVVIGVLSITYRGLVQKAEAVGDTSG